MIPNFLPVVIFHGSSIASSRINGFLTFKSGLRMYSLKNPFNCGKRYGGLLLYKVYTILFIDPQVRELGLIIFNFYIRKQCSYL